MIVAIHIEPYKARVRLIYSLNNANTTSRAGTIHELVFYLLRSVSANRNGKIKSKSLVLHFENQFINVVCADVNRNAISNVCFVYFFNKYRIELYFRRA